MSGLYAGRPARRGGLRTAVVALGAVIAALSTHAVLGTAAADESRTADPTAPGPHRVAVVEYSLGDTAFQLDGFTAELGGSVHYPAELGSRTHPLVVIAHGLFATCADRAAGAAWAEAREALHGRNPVADPAERQRQEKILAEAEEKLGQWPCPPGIAPVPSHRGYDYLAHQLASHGLVVVSVRANGINAGSPTGGDDFPVRAALINKHLAMWQELATTGTGPLAGTFADPTTGATRPVDFRGRVDLTNVGTMGHSRGGRGVMNHAADEHRADWPAGVQIKAVLPLEPVLPGGDDVVTRIPFATVIGACDFVSNPSSRQYFDGSRTETKVRIHQLFVHGANHTFFNTQWSPSSGQVTAGDDAYERATPPYPRPGHCRTTDPSETEEKQLSEGEQRRIGLAYMSAFFRRYLVGETRFDAMLTGQEHPMSGVGQVDVEVADPAR